MTQPGPGLDLAALRVLRGRRALKPTRHLLTRIAAHLEQHDGYVAFSGGKDSLAVLHLTRQVDPAVPVAWFDSGLEYPEHRSYIHDLADSWNLNLDVIPAAPTALEILEASGAWSHTAPRTVVPDLSTTLIDVPAGIAHDRHGPGELWGVRAAESRGRARLYATAVRREIRANCTCCPGASGSVTTERRRRHGGTISRRDGTTAYGPIWDWSTDDVWTYLAAHEVPTSPVYAKLTALGAPEHALRISTLITATGLENGRITWLRAGWPELYTELLTHLPRLAEFA